MMESVARYIIDDVLDGAPARNSSGEIVSDYDKICELEAQLVFYKRRYAKNYQDGVERRGTWNPLTNEVED